MTKTCRQDIDNYNSFGYSAKGSISIMKNFQKLKTVI